jgi:hypothetical protein
VPPAPSTITGVPPPIGVTMISGASSSAMSAAMPSIDASASHAASRSLTASMSLWRTRPLWPSKSSATTVGASPATMIVSLPRPPKTRVSTPAAVLWTKKWSSPSAPSTSRRSIPVTETKRP